MDLRTRALDATYRSGVRPVLFRMGGGDAETAHHRTLAASARIGSHRSLARAVGAALPGPSAPVEVAGIRFPGRVGLAAGVDKDGLALTAWPALGFGHVEVGTVTAAAQPGNPRPRLFRLARSGAIINRMGFNNAGADALAKRLRATGPIGVPVGVSLGKTKATPIEEATQDYLRSLALLREHADYLAINVSSPNTPGLRSLQDKEPLARLLRELVGTAGGTPIFVKIAPDLTDAAIDDVLEVAEGSGVAGLIATNTTLRRDGLADPDLPLAEQAGGLSGAPLTRRARHVVGRVSGRTALPVIGVGGVMAAADGTALLDAGAQLVQVYTGFVYRGPALVAELNRAFARRTP